VGDTGWKTWFDCDWCQMSLYSWPLHYLDFDVRSLNPVKTGSLVAIQTRIIECNPHIELKPVLYAIIAGDSLRQMTRLSIEIAVGISC
jgi:hypothetical protein